MPARLVVMACMLGFMASFVPLMYIQQPLYEHEQASVYNDGPYRKFPGKESQQEPMDGFILVLGKNEIYL